MTYTCKIFLAVMEHTSWGLVFCVIAHVCKISKVIGINTEEEICLSNRESISGHR